MGMFSRISDIVQANINAMLDKAEDPEKVIRLITQEMEETLVEVRSQAAGYIAEKKQIDRKIDYLNKQASQWHSKAELAIEKDREELAKAALVEKQGYISKAEELMQQKAQIDEMLSKIQEDTARLQEKLAEAKQKQKALVNRKNTSAARLKIKEVEHSDKINQAMSRFEQYEQRIDYLEAQVDAFEVVGSSANASSLTEQFAALEKNDEIEKELEEMKKKRAA